MKNKEIIVNMPSTGKSISQVNIPLHSSDNLSVNFSNFVFKAISLPNRFNNHFKNDEHFRSVLSDFIQQILPKITSHKFTEICEGSPQGKTLHFHTVDEEHGEIIREVLSELNFPKNKIEQIYEGHKIFEFSACLGHTYPARVFGYNVDNIIYLLFLDTNHHIYFNPKYAKDALFYEDCPICKKNECTYMPTDCFAVGYLDENKLAETYGYIK